MSIWDDPELAPAENYLKLDNEGDSFEGSIVAIRTQVWDDGSKCPQLTLKLKDGTEATWSAGQTQAKRKLAELRPEVGDYLRVVYTRQERRAGGKTLKHLDIQVDRGGRAVVPNATPVAPNGTGTTGKVLAGGAPAGMDPAQWSTLDRATQNDLLKKMGLAPAGAASSAEPPF